MRKKWVGAIAINIPKFNISLRVNLFVIICDEPMTAKAFNITQFNGKYGCFSCLHPGESSGHFSEGRSCVHK